jgi:hypothetical protein
MSERPKQTFLAEIAREELRGKAVIAGRLYAAPLEPVECALAGQRRTILAMGRELAGQHRHCRVVAQLVVIDQILVAQRQGNDPLPDQCSDRVLDQIRRPAVGETIGKPIDGSASVPRKGH